MHNGSNVFYICCKKKNNNKIEKIMTPTLWKTNGHYTANNNLKTNGIARCVCGESSAKWLKNGKVIIYCPFCAKNN